MLAVSGRSLDWFGGIVVGVVTAVGGGTMRGLILGVTPVFWIEDNVYLYAAVAGALLGIPLAHLLATRSARELEEGIRLVDAIGLALFAIVGANIALDLGFSPGVAVISAVLTGAGGGVIRDVISGRTPLIRLPALTSSDREQQRQQDHRGEHHPEHDEGARDRLRRTIVGGP